MKKIITFLLVIFSVTNLYAQDRVADSLKLLLSKEKKNTGKVNLLLQIGRRFGYGFTKNKNDSSLWYLQQALDLSINNKYVQGELQAQFRIGEHFYYSGNYPEALKVLLPNLNRAKQVKDTSTMFWEMRLIFWIFRDMGDNKNALGYAKEIDVLAHSLTRSKDYKISQVPYYAIADQNMGTVYSGLNLLDSALHYQLLVYKDGLRNKDPQWLALADFYLADTYAKMGNNDSAFSFYRRSIPYTIKAMRPDYEARNELGMAALFYKKGQSDSAFFYARQAMKKLQGIVSLTTNMEAYSLFSKLYQSSHRYDSAYKYLQSFVVLKDSLLNQSKITQAQNLAFNETIQQQQLEQSKKEAQQQYAAKIKLYILAGVILIFLIIAFLLLRNIRNKRKANILLSKQKKEIEEQKRNVESTLSELKSTQKQLIQSEKMASLGELTAGIAHEIQNPLNFVNNFSDVNKELLVEMKEELANGNGQEAISIANDVIENEQKINHHGKRADAIVKGMLQHSRTSTGQKEPTDINALADEYLRLSYHGLRAKDKSFNAVPIAIGMKTDFDESIGKINIIPQDIGRVLLNLYNNAFYAVTEKKKQQPEGYEPAVSVSTKKIGDKVEIRVKDNGNGIPQKVLDKIFQPFFTTKPTGVGTGLGLSLSYDIVKAHGGELSVGLLSEKVETMEGEGTEFIIVLPV